MSVRSLTRAGVLALCVSMASASPAYAGCVSKSAQATSPTQSSAKWFAMETMVQSVSWGLWPGWVATGQVAGHSVKKERYKCKADAGGYTCIGWATFCSN